MLRAHRRRLLSVVAIFAVFALLFGPRLARAVGPTGLAAAWQRAQMANSYQFASDIVQVTTPNATIANVGKRSHEERLRLEGQTDLPQHVMEMRLWARGGSVGQAESGVAVRVDGDKTMVRQGTEPWKETGDFIGSFAPNGDFLQYLQAITDITAHDPEQRAGRSFTRYSFRIDGPRFAAYMRDQTEATLRREEGLPTGAHLEVPAYFARMTGTGELWVGQDGLPLRQVLDLHFPEQKDEFVTAQISVDFSGWKMPVGWLPVQQLGRVLSNLQADPTPMVSVVLWSLFTVLVISKRRSPLLQKGLPLLLIVALLGSPLLQSLQLRSFFTIQSVKAATQEQQAQESKMEQTLRTLDEKHDFNPNASPIAVAEQQLKQAAQVAAITSQVSPNPQPLAADTGLDSDADGLTNYLEERLGTDPQAADTDSDLLSDALEVNGFSSAGQMWYSDPLDLDSNRDGLGDGHEWLFDANGDNLPDDTDNDGVPDIHDLDNDGDGVPDKQDSAPFTQSRAQADAAYYTETNPLAFALNNVQGRRMTYVDFQLRPQNPDHLWYAYNVLDWPNDQQGQVQDSDGKTFADLGNPALTSQPNDSYGDMKLVPMLELKLPGAPNADFGLPSIDELRRYNIAVSSYDADGDGDYDGKVAYVPLTLITNQESGERVAFSGRMIYRPGVNWGAAHEVKLVWVVQALVDQGCVAHTPTSEDPRTAICGPYNVAEPIQTYYDSWTLTGLNVREDRGVQMAAIYEDPTVDNNLQDDGALWLLASGLDSSFLAGRDCETRPTPTTCAGNGERDVQFGDIKTRFDQATNSATTEEQRWGIPNVLTVDQPAQAYNHLDAGVVANIETTNRILATNFSTHWSAATPIKPLVLYAREEQYRALGLDGIGSPYVRLDGSNLNLDLNPGGGVSAVSVDTLAGVKWAAYCGSGSDGAPAWTNCDQNDYWQALEHRHQFEALPEDGATPDPEVLAGRMLVTQVFYLALSQGINSVVQRDNTVLSGNYAQQTDGQLEGIARSILQAGRGLVLPIANIVIMARFVDKIGVLKFLGRLVTEFKNGLIGKNFVVPVVSKIYNVLRNFGSNKLAGTGIVLAAIVVLAILATGIATLIALYVVDSPIAPIATKVIITLVLAGLTGFFGLVQPIIGLILWTRALVGAGLGAKELISTVLKASSTVIGTSRAVGAIGAAIAITINWGFFIYAMVSNGVSVFSPEFNRALAEAIAATIYLILIAILSSFAIGLIIVTIVSLIDAFLTLICESGVDALRRVPGLDGACFTFSTAAIKVIAKTLYAYDAMVDTERNDLVVTGTPNIRLQNPNLGYVEGNPLLISMPVTTTVVHKQFDLITYPLIGPYVWMYSPSNLRSSTFRYSLTTSPQELNVERGDMRDEWFRPIKEDHRFLAVSMFRARNRTETGPVAQTLAAGLNQKAPFYLNVGYAIPAYECWRALLPPVCYTRTIDGHSSNYIDAVTFDIFPASLDGFMTMVDKGNGGRGLGWDRAFPALHDADNDGLVSAAYGGFDNDATWDSDGDSLSDKFEFDRRAQGVDFSPAFGDTDRDGLTDAQEIQYRTDPGLVDTDNDGLTDAEELYHQVYAFDSRTGRYLPTSSFTGGWDITITGVQTSNGPSTKIVRVSSDPTQRDGDGDGIPDNAERQLALGAAASRVDAENVPYSPRLFNQNPLQISVALSDVDGFVGPGQTVSYSTTVTTSGQPFAPGVLQVDVPSAFGGGTPRYALDLTTQPTTTVQTNLVAAANAPSGEVAISSRVQARLQGSGGPRWSWQPIAPDARTGLNPPAIETDATATRSDRGDSYLLTTLTSSNGRGRYAAGDIRADWFPGGQTAVLESDNSNRSFLRGSDQPNVACNDVGQCFTVWDHFANCNTFTIRYLRVDGADSDPGGGIEPVITLTRVGGTPTNIWTAAANGGNDMGEGDQRGPNGFGFPLTRTLCDDDLIAVREVDGGGANPVTYEPVGTYTFDIFRNGTFEQVFENTVNGHKVTLGLAIADQHYNDIAGTIVRPDTSVERAQFSLTSQTTSAFRDFAPVVATDGYFFLVAWERWAAGASQTDRSIWYRWFDGSGNPLGAETQVDSYILTALSGSSASLDLAWIGDRYRMVWRYTTTKIIEYADISATGSLGSKGIVTSNAAPDPDGAPSIAYNPAAKRSLVVYRFVDPANGTGSVRGRSAAANGNLGSEFTLNLSGATFQPLVAYYPATGGWIVGATNNGVQGTTYNYVAFTANDQRLGVEGDQVRQWTPGGLTDSRGSSLACPAPGSSPFIDLRFEELPGARLYTNSGGSILVAPGDGATSPSAGAPGVADRAAPFSDYALEFDGVDDYANTSALDTTMRSNFSIAFWLKTDQVAGQDGQWYQGQGLVDGYVGGSSITDFGVALSNGKIHFGVGDTADITIRSNPVADNNWHFVVATRNERGGNDFHGRIALYIDGQLQASNANANPLYLNGPSNLRLGSLRNGTNFYRGLLDHVQIFGAALEADTVAALYGRALQSSCLVATPRGNDLAYARLELRERDLRGGGPLIASDSVSLTIDTDTPTSIITSLHDGEYLQGFRGTPTTLIIGGDAQDPTSSVAGVEVSVNDGPWEAANGTATWTFGLKLTEGIYSIRTRATDAVGNVETPGAPVNLLADGTAPQTTADTTAAPVVPQRQADGHWSVRLSGNVDDPQVAGQAGSGIVPQAVQVALQGATLPATSNDWQTASVTGNRWTINYNFPERLADPTGSYAVVVRAADAAGNTTGYVDATPQSLRTMAAQEALTPTVALVEVDGTGPSAALSGANGQQAVISDTLTLTGMISDTSLITNTNTGAGIRSLEAAFVPIDQVVALSGTLAVLAFDERTGSVRYADTSGSLRDAQCDDLAHCPTSGVPGRLGSALQFDGTARAKLDDNSDFALAAQGNLAWQAWIKAAPTLGAGNRPVLVNRDGSDQWLTLALVDGVATLALNSGASPVVVSGGADLRDDQWHQLIGVVDGTSGQARLYVDGTERGSAAWTGSIGNSAPIEIGSWSGSGENTSDGFIGLIDQVALWNRALLAAEVAQLYAAADTAWYPATLTPLADGANGTTWSLQVPAGLEGAYQIDLRGTDGVDNQRVSPNTWRGIIDTQAPRVQINAVLTGAEYTDANNTQRYEVAYLCTAEDRHLQEVGFTCPGSADQLPSREFRADPVLEQLFPDLTIRDQLFFSTYVWEADPNVQATAQACDTYGHCATASAQPTGSSSVPVNAPRAVIVNPLRDGHVAVTDTLPVLLAASANQGLHDVTLSLDGAVVDTQTFEQAGAPNKTQRSVAVTPQGEGVHTLSAQATDWAGNIQPVALPITFTLDTQAPVVSLDTTELTAEDTIAVGSSLMRFAGRASDSVGLVAVQLKVGDGPWQDVTFDGTKWRTIADLGFDAYGLTYRITVRGLDRAGRISEDSKLVQVNIPDPANLPDPDAIPRVAPETSIVSGPANGDATATFVFVGTNDATAAEVLRFECRLDGGVFTACVSPQTYTNLAAGTHTFEVRAYDDRNTVDPSPAGYTWTVVAPAEMFRQYLPLVAH